jgi:hypothetical protein
MQKWSLAPFATPLLLAALHACSAAAPGEALDDAAVATEPSTEPAPVAHESAPPVALREATLDTDEEGHVRVQVPWANGTRLTALLTGDDPQVPAFHVEDGVAPEPDFTILAVKQSQSPRYYIQPVYATLLDEPELFVFDDGQGANGVWKRGIFRWSPRTGARFEDLPVPSTYGAFAPTALLARATDDVWAGAAIKREDFEPDFPGCPSIVWASLDDVYLAHWDGRAWTQVATPPFMGRLRAMSFDDAGALTLETGWTSEEREAHGLTEDEARDIHPSTWTLTAGLWTRR